MAVTRIKNNQITDLTVNAAAKLQDFSVTSAKIANNLTYGSDLTIQGNLTVQGNVTAIETHDLIVEDPLILLAKDQTGTPSLDIGYIGERTVFSRDIAEARKHCVCVGRKQHQICHSIHRQRHYQYHNHHLQLRRL